MSVSILALIPDTSEDNEVVKALHEYNEQSTSDRICIASPEEGLAGLPGRVHPYGMRLVMIDSGTLARKGSSTVMMLQRRYPKASIVCIGGRYSRSSVLSALSLGVHGFIGRFQSPSQIRQAIDIVLNGGIYLPDLATERPQIEVVASSRSNGGRDHFATTERRYQEELGLSPRQAVVLALLSEGMTNKAIARHLDLAEATVKVHVSAIYRALSVRNRAGAVAVALSLPLRASADLESHSEASGHAAGGLSPDPV